MEDCRIITSFYFCAVPPVREKIGILPYLYFLLLLQVVPRLRNRLEDCRIYTSFYSYRSYEIVRRIGRLPYLYFLLLRQYRNMRESRLEDCRIYTSFYFPCAKSRGRTDWKTAVFILPSTSKILPRVRLGIGRLPYLYFLLLSGILCYLYLGLEDCRIITSFYSTAWHQRI